MGCGYLPSKKTEEKSKQNKVSPKKRDEAVPVDTKMRTAFIRVARENKTGGDKEVVVAYTRENIEKILNDWSNESGLTYWFIEHNPDEDMENPHFHIVIKFKTQSRFSTVKNKFPFGNIQQAKSIRNTVQYLVHLNDLSKLSYSWDDVLTNCGDLSPYKVQSRSQQAVALQSIYDMIESGEITELNVHEKVTKSVYAENKNKIVNAFEHQRARFFVDANRDVSVIFVSGRAGKGKSEFAKGYCRFKGFTYCESSSSNDPLQDYKGQDVLILDDLRDDSFKYHDFLKLLDNHTGSTVRSRYHNKLFTGCLIIITSTKAINNWYFNVSEDKHQLYRRVKNWYKFDQEMIFRYEYNEKTFKYTPVSSCPIPAWCSHENADNKTIDMFTDIGLESKPLAQSDVDKNEYSLVPEATEGEKEARRAYEASLPAIDWDKVNAHRVG